MGNNWQSYKLGELGTFRNGANYNKNDYGNCYPVASVKNLFRGRFVTTDGLDAIKDGVIGNIDEYLLKKYDLLFARSSVKREGSGQVAIVNERPENCIFSGFTIRFRVEDSEKVDPLYLLYLFRSPKYREEFTRIATGTTIHNLSQANLANVEIELPSIEVQKQLARILGALDDKIELNRQINNTLESMAQALFKSWFVDFDPVIDNALAAGNPIPDALQAKAERRRALRENPGNPQQPLPAEIQQLFPSSFVFSEEMGWVPEGWEVSTIGNVVETTGGGTPSTKNPDFWEGGENPFCTPKDMSQLSSWVLMDTERHLTEVGVRKISSGQLPVGTVLMSSRAPIGYLAISDVPVSVNQGIIAMLPTSVFGPLYLLNWAKSHMRNITDRANGSTFLEISKKNFRPIPFLVPNCEAVSLFNKQAMTFQTRMLSLAEQTSALTKLRDSLLPKLLSGQIQIPKAEQQLADVI